MVPLTGNTRVTRCGRLLDKRHQDRHRRIREDPKQAPKDGFYRAQVAAGGQLLSMTEKGYKSIEEMTADERAGEAALEKLSKSRSPGGEVKTEKKSNVTQVPPHVSFKMPMAGRALSSDLKGAVTGKSEADQLKAQLAAFQQQTRAYKQTVKR